MNIIYFKSIVATKFDLYYNKLEWDDVMYKNKKRKQLNIKIIVAISIVMVLLGLSLSVYLSRSNFLGEGLIKNVVMAIDKVVMYPFYGFKY